MLDRAYIREHKEEIKNNCISRRIIVDIDKLLMLDEERRAAIVELDELRRKRNQGSKGKPTEKDIVLMRGLGEEIKKKEAALIERETAWTELLYRLPNQTHPDAPIGKDDSENVIVRKFGEVAPFPFTPKEHWELGEALDVIDIERASRVTGSRFAYLKGDLAMLEF